MVDNNYKLGLVSVGIPTYNRPENLERALKCISAQSYTNIEIIVSDNNSSSEKVKNIIQNFSRNDSRVKYYKQDNNIGVLANAEFVLKKATGEYFTWFSDDDWRSPEFIENMILILNANEKLNMAFCDYHEVFENGNRATGYPDSHINVFKPFQSQYRLVRIMSYYWQNSIYGKCNLFYSVFRKKALDLIDIKAITEGYKHLNMDNLIVYKMLQLGPCVISNDPMCTLTCGNQKYYTDNIFEKITHQKKIINIFLKLYKTYSIDRKLYSKNTSLFIEKLIINLLFIPKFLIELISIFYKKLFLLFKKNIINIKNKNTIDIVENQLDEKIKLSNVTLVAVATKDVEETLEALMFSCREIEFKSIKLLSHFTPYCKYEGVDFIRIQKMKNIDEWSRFIIYDLNNYIDSEYILLVHADGFVVNPKSWRNEFLEYDYIGAPWPLPTDNFSYRDINGDIVRVGNSVSLRSKKILELPTKLNLPWEADHGYYNEDGFLCVKNKHILEKNGIKFATLNIAKFFAHESMIPEIRNIKPFAFHKWEGTNTNYPKFTKK